MTPLVVLGLIVFVLLLWLTQGLRWSRRVFIVVGALGLIGYTYVLHGGNPDLRDYPSHQLKPEPLAQKALIQAQNGLIQHLQQKPFDCQAWQLLCGSYARLGHAKAASHIQQYYQQLCRPDAS